MLCIFLKAPFAAFRSFAAGDFRPTAGFITFSAAYGLLLNIAGIEMRDLDKDMPMTTTRSGLPELRMAIGALTFPGEHSIYQQLHNYPIGKSAKEYKPLSMGRKYNIAPIRRTFLSDLQAYICINGNSDLEKQVTRGLAGNTDRSYGIPFVGDNDFLIDRLDIKLEREPAYWYIRIKPGEEEGIRKHTTRLTITINREDMTRTKSALFAPISKPTSEIPDEAWEAIRYK